MLKKIIIFSSGSIFTEDELKEVARKKVTKGTITKADPDKSSSFSGFTADEMVFLDGMEKHRDDFTAAAVEKRSQCLSKKMSLGVVIHGILFDNLVRLRLDHAVLLKSFSDFKAGDEFEHHFFVTMLVLT